MRRRFSCTGLFKSIRPLARGPTQSFSIYISGAWSRLPLPAMAITAIDPSCPFAVKFVPSRGSTAISTGVPPAPTFSPIYSIGASSISPSPMTTVPSIGTLDKIECMPSTASWSAPILLPFPMSRPALTAAASVTRTNSSVSTLSIFLPPVAVRLSRSLYLSANPPARRTCGSISRIVRCLSCCTTSTLSG